MADKELNITIKTDADTSQVEDLSEALTSLKDEAEQTNEALSDLGTSTDSIDGSSIEDVSSSADNASDSLDNASSSADDLQSSVDGIDPSPVDNLGDSADTAGSKFDDLKGKVDDANDSVSMVDAMAGAEMSSSIVSGYENMADAAGNYGDTMVRVGYAMSGTSMTAKEAEDRYGGAISKMASDTGRGAGAVRNHMLNMANVGITSEDTIASSFEGISKASFQMGKPLDMLEAKFQKMVLSGNASTKMLADYGLSIEDLANAMGVPVDQAAESFKNLDANSRAAVLSTALNMKYGADVTENYKNSYQHLMETVDRAKEYLLRIVGEAVLPVLIPAVETATNFLNTLADGFSNLPGPIQTLIGGAISLSAGLTAVGLGVGAVVKVVGFALSPFMKLIDIFRNGGTLLNFASSLKTVGLRVLESGYNALKAAGMWVVEKGAKLASAIVNGMVTAAQWALNIAMSANPIMIVVLAIIALIAVLTYLYFNNEQVRQAIDALGQTLMQVGQIIYSTVMNAIQTATEYLTNFWNYLVQLGQQIYNTVISVGQQVISGIMNIITFFVTLPAQIASVLTNIISRVVSFGSSLVSNLVSSASRAVSNFMSQISSLPSRFIGELQKMLSAVGEWAATLPQKFWDAGVNAVKNFLAALGIASPGTMQRMLIWEITEMGKRVPRAGEGVISNITSLGEDIVSAYGNPQLNTEFGSSGGATGIVPKQEFNITFEGCMFDKEERVDEVLDILKNYFAWDNTTAGRTV